ncbi:MAG: hypothetical protein ACREMQ_12375 [Longimicrobiales bacterium]
MMARPARPQPWFATLTLALLFLGGCKDSGLPDRNLPLEEAMNRQWRYPVYEAATPTTDPDARVFTVDGRSWMTTGERQEIPQALLKPAGNAEGIQLFALVWDEGPFTRLYILGQDGQYRPLARAG